MWLTNVSNLSDNELQIEIDACQRVLSDDVPQLIKDEATNDLRELEIEQDRRKLEEWMYPLNSLGMISFN